MIIIAVLGVLAIMFVMGIQMGHEALGTSRISNGWEHRERAYYTARSAIEQAAKNLPTQAPPVDSLQDPWAQPLPPLKLDDGMVVTLRIEDEERRLPINAMVRQGGGVASGGVGEVDEVKVQQLQRMLEAMKANPDVANAIVDWLDSDSQARMPGGAESLDYRDYPVKNGRLDSVAELLRIKGVTVALYQGNAADVAMSDLDPVATVSPSQNRDSIPGLKQLITVRTDGPININTAYPFVLRSISEEVPPNVVEAIVRKRTEAPLRSLSELLQVPGFDIRMMHRFSQMAGVRSQTFRITVDVRSPEGAYIAHAIYKRGGDRWIPLAWEVD